MKKPWYKRWKVWGGVFVVVMIIGAIAPDPPEEVAEKPAPKESVEKAPVEVAAPSAEEIAAKEKADAEAAKAKAEADAKKAAEKAKVDEDVRAMLKSLVDGSGGVVTDIKPSPYGQGDWSTTWVIVSDAWYDSAEHEKERFAETVGDAVRFATNGEAMLVHFYDAYDKELAKERAFGGYKIER